MSQGAQGDRLRAAGAAGIPNLTLSPTNSQMTVGRSVVIHDGKDDVMTSTGQEISTLGPFARYHGIFFFGRIDLRPCMALCLQPLCWTVRQHNILDRATERNQDLIQEGPFSFHTNRLETFQSFT